MTPIEDLVYRLDSARTVLDKLADTVRGRDRARLEAKAEGVALAHSIASEYLPLTDDPGVSDA